MIASIKSLFNYVSAFLKSQKNRNYICYPDRKMITDCFGDDSYDFYVIYARELGIANAYINGVL